MSTAALRLQPERPSATAALRVFDLVGVRALRVRVRPGPGRSRCRTAWPGWSHAMTGFLDSTSACGSIGRRGGIEFSNGVIVHSDLGVECELVRRAFWTNPQQVDHPLLAALHPRSADHRPHRRSSKRPDTRRESDRCRGPLGEAALRPRCLHDRRDRFLTPALARLRARLLPPSFRIRR